MRECKKKLISEDESRTTKGKRNSIPLSELKRTRTLNPKTKKIYNYEYKNIHICIYINIKN